MKLKYFLLVLQCFITSYIVAQDSVFSQFSLIPETLNPGFTGFQYNWRAGLIHKRQWPDGNRVIETQFGFLNKMIGDKTALGLTVLNNHEVFTNYKYLQVNAAFSYKIELDNQWSIRPAIEAGYGVKSFNFGNLLLEDQINTNTGQINNQSIDMGVLGQKNNINFFDVSIGVLVDNEIGWFGASIKHLNKPNIAFVAGNNQPLDLFLSIHGGYAFDVDGTPSSLFPEETKLLLVANYMKQSEFNRLDIGAAMKVRGIILGANLTTNPEGKSKNSHLITSINPYLSVHFGDFNAGYSYDIGTSNLGRQQGIHELSLTWQLRFCESCVARVNKYYDYNK